jgi:hypothetical protein
MKKTKIALSGFAIAIAALLSFRTPEHPGIRGKVTPSRYGVHAWAISETDTLYTTIDGGNFEFPDAKPGVYRIVIEALSPYRHMAKENVVVREDGATDIGELSLHK